MKLMNAQTNEEIHEDASPALCEAACESETPVSAVWVDGNDQYELATDEDRETRDVIEVYGLP